MRRGLYSFIYAGLQIGLLGAAFALFLRARAGDLELPISFETPYVAFRSLVAVITFGFFLILMGRHVILMIIAVADHADRLRQDLWPGQRVSSFRPLVSIIVPAYNEGRCIEASIQSLLEIDYPRYQIIVVDDGSSDDTLARASKMAGDYGKAEVTVFSKVNGGKATALNFGIQRAAGDLVTTIDSDSVIEPQSLAAVVPHFEDEDVGAVAGSVKVVNTDALWSRLQGLEYLKGLNLVRRAQGFLRAVSIVPGPIGTFRKSALQGVGYYSTDTFAEDCDLTLKLLLAGWRIHYEPGAVARTEAPEQLMTLTKQRYRWTRGVLQAIFKHGPRMLRPRGASSTAVFMLWYMAFEAILWPLMTTVSIALVLLMGIDPIVRSAGVYFWLQLLIIDAAAGLYCIGIEQGPLVDLLLVPVERLVFQTMLELGKFMASIEEILGVGMTWGKLERKGLK